MTRSEVIKILESYGASVKSSVTSSTDILLVGSNRGNVKYLDALSKGVPIIPWPMFVAQGFLMQRSKIEPSLEDYKAIIVDTLLLMLTVVDNVYAHSITSGGNRFFSAYQLGSSAIDRFLRGAWGPGTDPVTGKLERPLRDTSNTSRELLRSGHKRWLAMIAILEDINNGTDIISENVKEARRTNSDKNT